MKNKNSFLIIFSFLLLFSFSVGAQSSVSVSTGISKDLNNENYSFYGIPVSVQWKPSKKEKAAFFLEIDCDFVFPAKGSGNAYTLNPSMPQELTLPENIHASLFTFSLGFRIHLYTNKKNNSFYLNLLPLGISAQSFKVSYKNFDKANYEVMNPDVNSHEGGLLMSMAVVYNFHKGQQNEFLMLHMQTPTAFGNKDDYPLSYKSIAPLQLTFGYHFYYKNKKENNEK
jgi:hypothetical protein